MLGHKLGQGGYGAVYLSELNGTRVAVKQINLEDGLTLKIEHRNEIQALGLDASKHTSMIKLLPAGHYAIPT